MLPTCRLSPNLYPFCHPKQVIWGEMKHWNLGSPKSQRKRSYPFCQWRKQGGGRGGVDGARSAKSGAQESHGESRSHRGSKAGPGAPRCDHQVLPCPASTHLISRGILPVSLWKQFLGIIRGTFCFSKRSQTLYLHSVSEGAERWNRYAIMKFQLR